ncbi:MAG: DNA polymerase III subunit delta [Cyclobacteriaceae bacterium]|nr:DNA polymerase III subunit delta [Cyclobacteriaceae bacterium]
MNFNSIPGLTRTKNLLITGIQHNHQAHAQLFAGQPGALVLPLALAYATYLHCENKGEDACGSCAACSKSLKYIHPDTHFVFPVGNMKRSKEIKGSGDDETLKAELRKLWRNFLLEQPFGMLDDWTLFYGGEDKQAIISAEESREMIKTLALKPFESKYKVVIIWCPEFMHMAAANSILKVLEEPPPHTYFILATQASDKLLPTIVSRTQRVTIPLLTDSEITEHLVQQGIEHKRAERVAQLAEGDLGLALQLLDKEEDRHTQFFFDWMVACYLNKHATLLAMAEEYHEADRLSQQSLLQYSLAMMRETLVAKFGAYELHRITDEERKRITKFTEVMNLKKIERSVKLINDAAYHIERNGSAKMIFLDLSLHLAEIIRK